MIENVPETTSAPNQRTRNIVILVGVIVGLIMLAVIIFLDPFGLNLLGRLRADEIAQAMPTDTALYMRLDLWNLSRQDLDSIVWAFSEDLKEEGKPALDILYEDLNELLQDWPGLTFTEDVVPWIGRGIGLGVSDLKMDEWGSFEEASIILVIETRNQSASDEFLVKLRSAMTEDSGEQFLEHTYQGATIYVLDTQYEYERVAMSRAGDLVLFSQDESDIKEVIDAQSGKSLANIAGYRDVVAALPTGSGFTLYLNGERSSELMSGVFGMYSFGLSELSGDSLRGTSHIAIGMSVIDVGVRMDMVVMADPEDVREQIMAAFAEGASRTASMLPEETLVHFYSHRLDLAWGNMLDSLTELEGSEDFEEAMEIFEISFGFNPTEDLFPNLDGEWGFGIIPNSEGVLAEQVDLPFGFALVVETSDSQALLEITENFSINAELQGFGEVEKTEDNQATYYELLDMFSGSTLIAYGVSDDFFVLGSSESALREIFADEPSLSESERYRQVWRAFPENMAPVLYVDIQGMLATIRESMQNVVGDSFDEEMESWENVTFFTMGFMPLGDDMMQATMILFIDTD